MRVTHNEARLTRRQFHRQVAGATVAGLVARLEVSAAGQSKFPPGRYVDVHTHLGQTWNGGQPLSVEALLRWMDSVRIAQAVVLPLISPEASSYPLTSDFVLAQTKPYRDRLVPFCSIDPRTSYRGGLEGAVEMLRRYIDVGAKGFGEHKPGVPIDDAANIQLFAACAHVKLPVLFHLDNLRNTDRPGLPGLDKVLGEVPDCIMIGHGPGWWASISGDATQSDLGGYPQGKVAPGGALDALMAKHANLYGDLSAGSGANAIRRDIAFGREFLIRRADRLMFGTDFLMPGQNVPQIELYDTIDLPEAVEKNIYRENARGLLGLV